MVAKEFAFQLLPISRIDSKSSSTPGGNIAISFSHKLLSPKSHERER